MSEPKFTAGEWTLLDGVVDGGIVGTNDDIICHLPMGDSKERRANAHLIAAAPDLYAACRAYYYGEKDERECERMMGEAIAKAEGR